MKTLFSNPRTWARLLTLGVLFLVLLPITGLGSLPANAAQVEPTPVVYETTQILAASDPSLGARPGETDFLPAWRWGTVSLDQDNGGLLGAVKSMPNSIALVIFAISNFVWQILLNITKLGLSADFITPAAPAINAGVAQIGYQVVVVFGIILIAFAVWRVVRGVAAGKGAKAFVPLVVCAVWMLATMGLTNASKAAAEAYDPKADTIASMKAQASYKGTLPWLMLTVTRSVDKAATLAVSSWGLSERIGGSSTGIKETSVAGDVLTCDRYISTLHKQYLDYKDPSGKSISNTSLAGLSRLWEGTLYRSWTTAQFGTTTGTDLGARVMCHYAESVNNVPASEQAAVSALAYGAPFSASTPFTVFGPHVNDENQRRAVAAWANCQLTAGRLSATPELKYSFDGNPSAHDKDCASSSAAFSTNKDGLDGMYLDVFGNSEKAFDVQNRETDLSTARGWERAWFGGNVVERLLNSLLALLVALVMFYSLGFISIGLILVQFTMVILLLLVPVLLALLAIGKSTDKVAGLFKLLGTSAFTKAFFGIIVALLVEIASIGQAVVNFLPAGGGLFGQILKGFMPLAALLVVRRLLQNFGMGDILRPMGAVTFATTAAVKATNDRSGAAESFTNAVRNPVLERKSVQNALTKADRYAPVVENWNREGREKRREEIADEREEKLDRRAEERSNRGDGRLDKVKDWANARGLNMDKIDEYARGGAKGAAIAGAGVISAGAAPLLTGLIAGGKGAKVVKGRLSGQDRAKAADNLEGLPTVSLGKQKRIDSVSAEAQLRSYKRRRTATARSGGDAEALDEQYVGSALQGAVDSLHGPGFSGFTTEADYFGAQMAFANQTGYKAEDVLVGTNGIILPRPVADLDDRRNLSVDQLSDWVHWLPTADSEMRDGETDDQYVSRLFATGFSRGLVSADGEAVDIWSKLGLDIRNSNDRRRVEAFIAGGKDELLSKTTFDSRDSSAEKLLIKSAQKWMKVDPMQVALREQQLLNGVVTSVHRSRADMRTSLKKGSEASELLEASAKKLFEAREIARVAITDEARAQARAALESAQAEFGKAFTALNQQYLDVAQDLVSHRADIALGIGSIQERFNGELDSVGLGELRGIDELEGFIVAALSEHVERLSLLEESRDAVLIGSLNEQQLSEVLRNVEKEFKNQAATLLMQADKAGKEVAKAVSKQGIDVERLGSSIKTQTSLRKVVEGIGSDAFPAVKKLTRKA